MRKIGSPALKQFFFEKMQTNLTKIRGVDQNEISTMIEKNVIEQNGRAKRSSTSVKQFLVFVNFTCL